METVIPVLALTFGPFALIALFRCNECRPLATFSVVAIGALVLMARIDPARLPFLAIVVLALFIAQAVAGHLDRQDEARATVRSAVRSS